MKISTSPLFLLLGLITRGLAQKPAMMAALEAMPPCAFMCVSTAMEDAGCGFTDNKCLCTSTHLQHRIEGCLVASCTTKQILTTTNITMTACKSPVRDNSHRFKVTNIILAAISVCSVLVRIIFKAFVTAYELGMDDYFIIATIIVGFPSTILNDVGLIANGFGKDIWTLHFHQITAFFRWFYVLEVLYFAQIMLLKMSLLFFYYRIFPQPAVKRTIWATVAFNSLFGLAFVTIALFQCHPTSHFWHYWEGEQPGECMDLNAMAWSNAAISIALDIFMLAIPLSQVCHLKMAWKRKVGVASMFVVGTFVTMVSILRLRALVHFGRKDANPTWDYVNLIKWSMIEVYVGIICACMPTMRIIFVRLFPKALGSTKQSYRHYARHQRRGNAVDKSAGTSGKKDSTSDKDKSVIKCTTTFEILHSATDEIDLADLEDMGWQAGNIRSSGCSNRAIF